MKYITKKHLIFSSVFLALTSQGVIADDQTLDTIVVTASRTEQKLSDTLTTTTVITRQDIDRLQPPSLTDLLQHEVGVDYAQNGGKGTTPSLYVRGTNADHVVVLVDGVRINTVDNGTASLDFIDLENIDHIEIVRGPVSSLYGNDAIGGVIQIFTRKGNSSPTTTVKAGYGSNAETLTSVNSGGVIGGTHYNVLVGYNQTNGINATTPNNSSYDPDHDGYRNAHESLSMSQEITGGHDIGFTFNHNQGQVEFDQGETNFDNQSASIYANVQATDTLKSTLTVSNFLDKQTTPIFPSTYNTNRVDTLWQNNWQASTNDLVTAGYEYTQDNLHTDQGFAVDSRYSNSVFLQNQLKYDTHSLQLGVRNDSNSQYGTANTGNIGYGYALSDTLKFFTNYGTAFHAPTFVDLYYPYGYGNPDLKPEKSRSTEVGLKSSLKSGYWTASVYQTKIHDLIELDSFYVPYNTDKATIEGIDVTAGTAVANWHFAAHGSLLNPTDDTTGQRLVRRSKQLAGVDADVDLNSKLSIGTSWHVQGNRRDTVGYDGGFNTVDLHGTYYVLKDLSLSLAVKNIFDNNYTVAYGYATPGREAMLTAALKI